MSTSISASEVATANAVRTRRVAALDAPKGQLRYQRGGVFEPPPWLPNWRDRNEYPNPASIDRAVRWAWEFIRRSRKYRSHYEHSLKGPDWAEPISERWGIKPMADPAIAIPDSDFVRWKVGVLRFPHDNRFPRWIPEAPSDMAVIFDLGRSLDDQLALAKKLLNRQRRELLKSGELRVDVKKPRVNKFPDYLRIIDAFATERNKKESKLMSELAAALYGKTKEPDRSRNAIIKDVEKAAYYLNGGYADIIEHLKLGRDK